MIDINFRKNPYKFISCILLLISLYVVVYSSFKVYEVASFNHSATRAIASVSDVISKQNSKGEQYLEYLVSYEVNNKLFTDILLKSSKKLSVNEKIDIYYNSQNPSQISSEYKQLHSYIVFFIIAFLFLISSVLCLVKILLREYVIKRLLKTGKKSQVKVIKVATNEVLRLIKQPKFLVCTLVNNSQVELYSDNIWVELKEDMIGKVIPIYYQEEFEYYYIDVRSIYNID